MLSCSSTAFTRGSSLLRRSSLEQNNSGNSYRASSRPYLYYSGHQGNVEFGPCGFIWRGSKGLESGRQKEQRTISCRFCISTNHDEFSNLKSQIVTSSWGGARRALPYAFTEHGILMLSSVLRSPRAVQVNIEIMRAFISLRELIASNASLAQKLNQMEKKYDAQFKVVFKALREILNASPPVQKQIGFRSEPS